MSWQRARSPEQKSERRRAILDAAAALFCGREYEAVSLNAIARQVGLAKSNLYRYFETKEQIFIQIYLEDVGEWVELAERVLEPLAGCDDPDRVARELTQALVARPRMLSLLALLSGVLERNLSLETLVEFKTVLTSFARRLVAALRAALPGVTDESMIRFVIRMHAVVVGLWPMANPSEVVRQALARPEFSYMRVDFGRELEAALRGLLGQLLAEARQPGPVFGVVE